MLVKRVKGYGLKREMGWYSDMQTLAPQIELAGPQARVRKPRRDCTTHAGRCRGSRLSTQPARRATCSTWESCRSSDTQSLAYGELLAKLGPAWGVRLGVPSYAGDLEAGLGVGQPGVGGNTALWSPSCPSPLVPTVTKCGRRENGEGHQGAQQDQTEGHK